MAHGRHIVNMISLLVASAIATAWAAAPTKNTPLCDATDVTDGQVVRLSDGKYDRCVTVVTPSNQSGPMGVLFDFHGAGGSARNCEHSPLVSLAHQGGFALVCGEALQNIFGNGGQWEIPEIQTNETGMKCGASDSLDVDYIKAAIQWLQAKSSAYDINRIFFTGCSMGSAFTGYISQCLKQGFLPGSISALATHSTGLKEKGDGIKMPPDNYNRKYMWGECDGCQYFPFVPKAYTDKLGLKACIFDNTGDDNFYNTSVNMARIWKQYGNKVETHFLSGGHCQIHSFATIVNCLDDGSRRLLPGGNVPDVPSPSPSPGPGPSPEPPMECQQCFRANCPGLYKHNNAACHKCMAQHRGACARVCAGKLPFDKAVSWYCESEILQNVVV